MTGRFDDLGNFLGDLGSQVLILEWQVGLILAIIGGFFVGHVRAGKFSGACESAASTLTFIFL